MFDIMDWVLEKLRLGIEEEEPEKMEPEEEIPFEIMRRKKEKEPQSSHAVVFFKDIMTHEDGRMVIDHYKQGKICIFRFASAGDFDKQRIMDYISGGIFALKGTIMDLGENMFLSAGNGTDILVHPSDSAYGNRKHAI